MKVKSESEVTQLCPTLSDLMDCSLPGSSVHGVFQARVLEWGAIAFSCKDFRRGYFFLFHGFILTVSKSGCRESHPSFPPWFLLSIYYILLGAFRKLRFHYELHESFVSVNRIHISGVWGS